MRMSYLRGMSGYLLVVDGTRRQTLEDALALNDRVVAEVGKVPAVLVLNKFDLTDQWEIDPAREAELTAAGWTVRAPARKPAMLSKRSFCAGASHAGQINVLELHFRIVPCRPGLRAVRIPRRWRFPLRSANGRTGARIFGARSPTATQPIGLADNRPFLENFLVDAEEFWSSSQPGSVNSGNWIERGADGKKFLSKPTARSLDGKRIFLLQNLSETFGQQQQWFQTARDSLLEHEKLLEGNPEERNPAALHRSRSHAAAQRHERSVFICSSANLSLRR